MVFSALGYIWASAREVRNFVCLKWKIVAERSRGGSIKDLSFKLQGGCSFSEEIRSNTTWFFVCFIENILQYRIATRPANQGNQLFTLFRGVLIVMTTMKIEETSCGDYPLFVRQSISPPKWEWHDFFGSYPSYNILQSADNITQFCIDYFFVLVIEWVRRTLNERSKSSNNKRKQNKPSFNACISLANTFSDDNTSGMGNGCSAKESSSNWYSDGRRSKSSGMISRSSYDCLSHHFLRLFSKYLWTKKDSTTKPWNGAIEAFLDSVP